MKKSIIALAVAGAMTAPMVAQADATLFGEARYDITKQKDLKVDSDITRFRVGVKGEETMDSGLTAGYYLRLETAAGGNTTTVSTSKVALYVAGDFGKIVMGQADNPSASVEDRTNYVTAYGDHFAVVDGAWDKSGLTYESNNLNGLQFKIGMGNVDTSNKTRQEDAYGAMVSYDTDSFGVTVGAGRNNSTAANNKADSHYGVSGEYKFGAGALGLSYTDQDDVSRVALSGKYSIDKLTLAAQFENRKTEVAGAADLKEKAVALSAAYALGGNATVSISAVNFNDDAEKTATNLDAVKVRYHVSF